MESERLNRWLTLGANLGVLVGILLLVFELNQNRDLVRAQTENVGEPEAHEAHPTFFDGAQHVVLFAFHAASSTSCRTR